MTPQREWNLVFRQLTERELRNSRIPIHEVLVLDLAAARSERLVVSDQGLTQIDALESLVRKVGVSLSLSQGDKEELVPLIQAQRAAILKGGRNDGA